MIYIVVIHRFTYAHTINSFVNMLDKTRWIRQNCRETIVSSPWDCHPLGERL